MKLYEMGPSRSARVAWTLRELGVAFESAPINFAAGDMRKPEFLALNPAGKVPVLEDDGFVLSESAAIMIYLAEKYPDHGLLPTDLKERAETFKWMFFCVTELEQPLWRTAKHQFLYPEGKRSTTEVELAREDFMPMAAVLEQRMQGREFVVGNHCTIADLILAYTLDWATMYGWLEPSPNLTAYVDRMFARPKAPMRMAKAFAAASM